MNDFETSNLAKPRCCCEIFKQLKLRYGYKSEFWAALRLVRPGQAWQARAFVCSKRQTGAPDRSGHDAGARDHEQAIALSQLEQNNQDPRNKVDFYRVLDDGILTIKEGQD